MRGFTRRCAGKAAAMSLLLAPMEGLLDCTLRDVLTHAGGIDRCVSEFIRVTGTLLPERVFTRIVPELLHGGRTPAGTAVRAQLLGSDAACLAENAAVLAGLGPAGIDLNFGCPAKVVNRHGGGASLLREPRDLQRIVAAVRRAVPASMPVSAKMRLGYDDDSRAEECAIAIAEGGACEIVVHARTKAQGYRPPAHWERVAQVREAVRIPVVANGEIWTLADALRCREVSGCTSLMLGRGMVADPGLALAIRAHDAGGQGGASWREIRPLLRLFWDGVAVRVEPRHRAGRVKQWLNLMRRRHPEAEAAYMAIRTVQQPEAVAAILFGHASDIAALHARPASVEMVT
jgi:tRNA-dihydrouridine synthase C